MITLKETAVTTEHMAYILMLLRDYCAVNEDIHEVNVLKHGLNDILKYIDKMYTKLLEEEII